jgi:hypothetical protein
MRHRASAHHPVAQQALRWLAHRQTQERNPPRASTSLRWHRIELFSQGSKTSFLQSGPRRSHRDKYEGVLVRRDGGVPTHTPTPPPHRATPLPAISGVRVGGGPSCGRGVGESRERGEAAVGCDTARVVNGLRRYAVNRMSTSDGRLLRDRTAEPEASVASGRAGSSPQPTTNSRRARPCVEEWAAPCQRAATVPNTGYQRRSLLG